MARRFQTIFDYNSDLIDLITELLLALSACKGAKVEEINFRQAGDPLEEYITVPGGSGAANLYGFGAGTMTDLQNYVVGDRINDPSDPWDTNF